MEKFVPKPNELLFLQRMAQATDDEEGKKIEQEYDTQAEKKMFPAAFRQGITPEKQVIHRVIFL
jgi:hypothetical protein